jgi:hypothetical protein
LIDSFNTNPFNYFQLSTTEHHVEHQHPPFAQGRDIIYKIQRRPLGLRFLPSKLFRHFAPYERAQLHHHDIPCKKLKLAS